MSRPKSISMKRQLLLSASLSLFSPCIVPSMFFRLVLPKRWPKEEVIKSWLEILHLPVVLLDLLLDLQLRLLDILQHLEQLSVDLPNILHLLLVLLNILLHLLNLQQIRKPGLRTWIRRSLATL